MPTISEIRAITTSISIRVTPALAGRLVLPADDVGIDPISAGLPVGAQADDVGLVSVFTWIVVNEGMLPRIVPDIFLDIRPLPVLHAFGLQAERLQALLGGRELAGVEFIGTQRSGIRVNLGVRLSNFGAVRLVQHLWQHQRCE